MAHEDDTGIPSKPEKKPEEIASFENEGGMTTAGPRGSNPKKIGETDLRAEQAYQMGITDHKPGDTEPSSDIPKSPPLADPGPADTAALSLVNGALKVNASLASREGIGWLIGLLAQTRAELFDQPPEQMPGVEVPMMAEPKLSSTELLGGKRPVHIDPEITAEVEDNLGKMGKDFREREEAALLGDADSVRVTRSKD